MQVLVELQERCTELGWKNISHRLDALLEEASANSITYAEFLNSLLKVEEAHRKEASWNRKVKNARFPFVKTCGLITTRLEAMNKMATEPQS